MSLPGVAYPMGMGIVPAAAAGCIPFQTVPGFQKCLAHPCVCPRSRCVPNNRVNLAVHEPYKVRMHLVDTYSSVIVSCASI